MISVFLWLVLRLYALCLWECFFPSLLLKFLKVWDREVRQIRGGKGISTERLYLLGSLFLSFIYFLSGRVGSSLLHTGFLSPWPAGFPLQSWGTGFSGWGAQVSGTQVSGALVCRLNGPMISGILLNQGWILWFPALAGRFLTTGHHLESPCCCFFKSVDFSCNNLAFCTLPNAPCSPPHIRLHPSSILQCHSSCPPHCRYPALRFWTYQLPLFERLFSLFAGENFWTTGFILSMRRSGNP